MDQNKAPNKPVEKEVHLKERKHFGRHSFHNKIYTKKIIDVSISGER
jgi:hypothetical protein